MKRIRVDRLRGQLLAARSPVSCSAASVSASSLSLSSSVSHRSIRSQSTASATKRVPLFNTGNTDPERFPPLENIPREHAEYPSPLPERALRSPKLAALHARLGLPQKYAKQTLARALVDPSADPNPNFNNANLAFVGQTLINYHVAEWLMVRYPRLPQDIIFSAMKGYAGIAALTRVARSWGVETAAVPGGEVDPGLLQFDASKAGLKLTSLGYERKEAAHIEKFKFRRGINSRIVFDDDFGDMVKPKHELEDGQEGPDLQRADFYTKVGNDSTRAASDIAHANFVRAVIGAMYTHCGRDAVKKFVKAHILSRTLDLSKLFEFKQPTRELALLCAREDWEPPIARLLSETGRLSRTPVFVVGIYSGKDKLGEASAANLDYARIKAAMVALKTWYLYSPGENVRVPSDMLEDGAAPWDPPHIDLGEIISR